MKTILVCGSREWRAARHIREVLEQYDPHTTTLVHGAARGADQLAGKLALELGWPPDHVHAYPADWDRHGKAAGVMRNQLMLDSEPISKVYAFRLNGLSRGTDDMIRRARSAGIETVVITAG